MQMIPRRELFIGLVGAILLLIGSVKAWAAPSGFCSANATNGVLTCYDYCTPPGCSSANSSQESIPMVMPNGTVVWVTVTYSYCACVGGPEDNCCHIVVVTAPPWAAGFTYARGICDPAINCYTVGNCKAVKAGGTYFPECSPGGGG
jgi:hypothetical protein